MRILSWNINGIRTLPQYHPWNTLKTCEGILNELKADIICFQEMKSSRTALDRHAALPPSYDAFFSFPTAKGGYSGVGVYTSAHAVPLKAEEGLTGRLQPKPPLNEDERIGGNPSFDDMEDKLFPDEKEQRPSDLAAIDAEGRTLVLDFGLFVLINVYCPNETSDARLPYKMNFHLVLEERVKNLVAQGREVIVLGDMNICATPLDHCDGHLPSHQEVFWNHPARRWFRDWLAPGGAMVDVVRRFHPDRRGMYTCWNMKIMARETNYGTRVDYILATPGLLPWIKAGDIQPALKGSDHCPIYIDLHASIVGPDGETRTLEEAMRTAPGERREPPRLASKFWDEYSGKQKLLSSFFGAGAKGKVKAKAADAGDAPTPSPAPAAIAASSVDVSGAIAGTDVVEASLDTPDLDPSSNAPPPPSLSSTTRSLAQPPLPSVSPITPPKPPTLKRKSSQPLSADPAASDAYDAVVPKKAKAVKAAAGSAGKAGAKEKGKAKAGQQKLSSFFSKPATSGAAAAEPVDVDAVDTPAAEPDEDADYRFALALAAADGTAPGPGPASQDTLASASAASADTKAAWSGLFARAAPPLCGVHAEPARLFTVNKAGPNRGRAFFVCARPVGPGYDKGRGARLRAEVDARYKCDFFVWASDVKKDGSPRKP